MPRVQDLQKASVLRCPVISWNRVCLLHTSSAFTGSQTMAWQLELETFVSSVFSTTKPPATVCWCQYICHKTPLNVTEFKWRKPSFQFWPCHFPNLWLWTSPLTSLQLDNLTSKIAVRSSHRARWGLNETSVKPLETAKWCVLAGLPLTPPHLQPMSATT